MYGSMVNIYIYVCYGLSHDNLVTAGAPSAPGDVQLSDDNFCSWNKSGNMPDGVPLNYTVIVENAANHKKVCNHLIVELHMYKLCLYIVLLSSTSPLKKAY